MTGLKEIKASLNAEYNISFEEQLFDGHMGVPIFRAKQNNRKIVIKIGFGDTMAVEEVRRNIAGYKEMQQIGAENIVPGNIQIISVFDLSVIIMEDLGENFKEQSKSEKTPLLLFQNLITGLISVYTKTLSNGNRASEFLQEMKECLLRQYSRYLLPATLIDNDSVQKVQNIDLEKYATNRFCFGVWDFTPEDIFVKGSKIYYIDPPPKVTGVPIIDIACFAGVSRDVYRLPNSDEGYELLYNFAVNQIADLLEFNHEQAISLFLLGRAVQLALSSRFRIEEDIEKARNFAQKSVEFVQQIVNTV